MKSLGLFSKIFLYSAFVDMRNQLQGLSAMVEGDLKKDPFDGSLYVFCNKRRDLIKCLYWDQTGFAMWVKRLDQEKFSWPKLDKDEVLFLTTEQMQWLLSGINIWKIKTHKKLQFEKAF